MVAMIPEVLLQAEREGIEPLTVVELSNICLTEIDECSENRRGYGILVDRDGTPYEYEVRYATGSGIANVYLARPDNFEVIGRSCCPDSRR